MKTWFGKKSGLNGIRNHDVCDVGAVLYRLSYQANSELIMLGVCNMPPGEEAGEYMKHQIYLNCGERYEDMTDHCSYIHNLSSCEIKA